MKSIDLNTSPALPDSSGSREGATSSSLGDATMGDLKKGFYRCDHQDEYAGVMPASDNTNTGFLGRPHGWER